MAKSRVRPPFDRKEVFCAYIFYVARIHSMSRDGMWKDGRKISPIHVTLKADVRHHDTKMMY